MRIRSLARFVGVGSIVATGATAVAESLVLRRIDRIEPPIGWRAPSWPDGERRLVGTSDGAELVVETTGDPRAATVVLVHGLTGDHESWGHIASGLLDRGMRVVGVNQRGHGGSTVGAAGFGPARQGVDLGEVLEALDLREVTLVGHSMGGAAAMSLLTTSSEPRTSRVAGLLLIATLADSRRPDRRGGLWFQGTRWYERLRANPRHSTVIARWIFGQTPSRAQLEDAMDVGRRCPEPSGAGAAIGMLDYDVRDRLRSIDVPTIVLCGTRDLLTPHRENKRIAAAITGAAFRSVEGAGHMVIWEDPGAIVDAAVELARTARAHHA